MKCPLEPHPPLPLFDRTSPRLPPQIQKVQNRRLWERYVHRRKEVAEENGNQACERILFHGSPFINAIVHKGFDERHAYIGGMFGAGEAAGSGRNTGGWWYGEGRGGFVHEEGMGKRRGGQEASLATGVGSPDSVTGLVTCCTELRVPDMSFFMVFLFSRVSNIVCFQVYISPRTHRRVTSTCTGSAAVPAVPHTRTAPATSVTGGQAGWWDFDGLRPGVRGGDRPWSTINPTKNKWVPL